jgi:predicted small integral membrane protein
MGRPVGVTIIAILDFLGAAFCIIGGIGMIAGGGLMALRVRRREPGSWPGWEPQPQSFSS